MEDSKNNKIHPQEMSNLKMKIILKNIQNFKLSKKLKIKNQKFLKLLMNKKKKKKIQLKQMKMKI